MINKRLIGTVPDSKPYIAGNVALQWFSLLSNAGMIFSFAWFLQQLLEGAAAPRTLVPPLAAGLAAVLVRGICTVGTGRMSFLAARSVKRTLRRSIYEKLLRLGPAYSQNMATSEAVQLAAEGVEQLETYFGAYLPQFFYSMLAPATLFALLAPVSLRAALALLGCVPLIPAAIAAVQTFAKKLLGRYWGQYTALGDTFLENLQGLTTLKIYQADGYKQEEMNREAEKFRRITMKVLTMQLNSITIMDLVAYGGAALGMVLAIAFVLVTSAVANALTISALLTTMAMGAVFANLCKNSSEVMSLCDHVTPPVFMMFFVLSGAGLNLAILPSIGVVGVIYVVLRVMGKMAGAWFGATVMKADHNVRRWLGPALIPQAGVAIGLTVVAQQVVPQYAEVVRAVVLCGTLIYELVGPGVAKWTLQKAGEIEPGQ